MKLGWGWKIGILYGVFVLLISGLVVASTHQHFDLVSKDYYEQEIHYQNVLDAGKNQSALSAQIAIHATGNEVILAFPEEFKGKIIAGDIKFYSPVNSAWDYNVKLDAVENSVTIPRNLLHNTRYVIKISCKADGKNYYQESEILLHA